MAKFLFNLPERQLQDYRDLSERTGLSIAEIIRRMSDYCFKETTLNILIPAMSGHLVKWETNK